jgi:hypothetical protein
MSGQPLRKSGDSQVFREQYLANLGLRAKIDDKNLQANKTYKRTGQLPVEPTDTRTLAEKYADIERIKIDVRNKLLTITDGINAQQIITTFNEPEIIFLSQQWEPISSFMKKNYSLGVPAPIFIDYLDRYIIKFNSNKGVEDNLQQQNMMNDLIFNTQAILSQMPSAGEIRNLNLAIIRGNLFNKRKQEQISQLLNYVMKQNEELDSLVREVGQIDNAIQKDQLQELLSDAFQNIPKKEDIREFMEGLSRPIDLENRDKMNQIADDIASTFETAQMNAGDIAVIRQLLDEYTGQKSGGAKAEARDEEDVGMPPQDFQQEIIPVSQINSASRTDLIKFLSNIKKDLVSYYTSIPTLDERHNQLKDMSVKLNERITLLNSTTQKKATSSVDRLTDANLRIILKEQPTQRIIGILYGRKEEEGGGGKATAGKGISGGAIYKPQKRYDVITKDEIDNTKGIKASPKFVPFGRFIIHKNQLDKDIISIRRPTGSSVGNLPSSRVSRKLGGMLRKIIGGGVPSFDELNSLDDEEKAFLHKVARETRIDDKISIPTPQKDEEDKLINEFEILRGQIVAGNDNAELIKKFRIALVKMGNKGLIPKSQMKDLLLDIATL